MNFPEAPLGICALAAALLAGAPSHACGVFSATGRIAEATERAELKLEDGRTLRLAGLDAPRPELALDRIAEAWTGRDLRIAILAPAPDRWGRWLADVGGEDGAALSEDLLSDGLARVRPEFETRNCEAERLATESAAREARRGLWAEPGAILAASDVAALEAADGRFVVVAGAVRRVGEGRARVYLDFGGPGGFTVVAPRKSEAVFQRRGVKLSALAGRQVRVRGYLDRRFGPRIEIVDPLMIELAKGM